MGAFLGAGSKHQDDSYRPRSYSQNYQRTNSSAEEQVTPLSKLAQIRIKLQLEDIQNSRPVFWRVVPSSNRLNEWTVWITADNSSPFRKYPFSLKVIFPANYPHQHPEITVEKPEIFLHPNIHDSGHICYTQMMVDRKDIKTRQRIEMFLLLLSDPNPHNGYPHSVATKLCLHDRNEYFKNALLVFRGIIKKGSIRLQI